MKYTKFLLAILMSVMLFSCARKEIYTTETNKKYKFSEGELKTIQFYTSEKIILYQSTRTGEVFIDRGKILEKYNEDIKQIIIKNHTKCVLEEVVGKDMFLISFADMKLVFGTKDKSGYYSLMAKNWDNGVGEIDCGTDSIKLKTLDYTKWKEEQDKLVHKSKRTYEDIYQESSDSIYIRENIYLTSSGKSSLMIAVKKHNKVERNNKYEKGRKVKKTVMNVKGKKI